MNDNSTRVDEVLHFLLASMKWSTCDTLLSPLLFLLRKDKGDPLC